EYRQQPGSEFTQGSLAYVANVNVDESIASKKEIFQKILEKIPDFEVVENYSYAVIQIPQEVKLLSEENSDKEFNYTFQTPFIQGLVNLSSKIGDNILVEAQTVFKGTQIIQAIAVEKKNITRQPEVIYLQAEVELLELKNELSLVAQKPFPTIDLNKVRDEINSLEIVESNEIQVNDSGIIVLTLKDADEGKIKAIGNVFEQIPEINFTGIDRDEAKKEYYIQIDFNKQSDFNFLVNSIDSVIASNGFTKDVDYLQVLPVITYVSNIKTTTPKITEENRQQIKEKLSIFDSKIFVLKQKAYIDVNSLNLGDRIDEIIDSVEKIEGIVNLGHIQGDKIQANIDFIRIINQASNIRFEEIDVEE
ncbi:MAG: hypothetical protein Q7K42_05440, partial [Candidatus Diapherotrites archaeon]|nr:hypothetical protein [Candidatus Diapherotrites archaeon]